MPLDWLVWNYEYLVKWWPPLAMNSLRWKSASTVSWCSSSCMRHRLMLTVSPYRCQQKENSVLVWIQILWKFREISLTALPRRRPAPRPRSCPRCLPRGGRCCGSGRTSAGVPEVGVLALELQTNHGRGFHNHGECPSLLGSKDTLRHYAKWVLTRGKYLNSCEMETPRKLS